MGVRSECIKIAKPGGAALTEADEWCIIGQASTSLGEAATRTQATDPERRKTPRVRTAPPGLRVEPKWLPVFRSGYAVQCQSSDERGAPGDPAGHSLLSWWMW